MKSLIERYLAGVPLRKLRGEFHINDHREMRAILTAAGVVVERRGRGNKPKPPGMVKRDEEIRACIDNCQPVKEVAQIFGLTDSRIRQIANRDWVRPPDKKSALKARSV